MINIPKVNKNMYLKNGYTGLCHESSLLIRIILIDKDEIRSDKIIFQKELEKLEFVSTH